VEKAGTKRDEGFDATLCIMDKSKPHRHGDAQ
jgi:hypothetical protein